MSGDASRLGDATIDPEKQSREDKARTPRQPCSNLQVATPSLARSRGAGANRNNSDHHHFIGLLANDVLLFPVGSLRSRAFTHMFGTVYNVPGPVSVAVHGTLQIVAGLRHDGLGERRHSEAG